MMGYIEGEMKKTIGDLKSERSIAFDIVDEIELEISDQCSWQEGKALKLYTSSTSCTGNLKVT